jgi:hypothetical protein
MQHLSPERIAALVDEVPTLDERHHFEHCALCRADFIAMRRIVAAASAERERPIAPLVPWQQLATALRDEGLLASPRSAMVSTPADIRPILSAPSVTVSQQPGRGLARWQRLSGLAAAAALLVTVGVAGGRLTAPRPAVLAELPATVGSVQQVVPAAMTQPVVRFRTPDDARATLSSAEQVYSGALMWLAANDSALAPRMPGGSAAAASSYRERLEVLDAAMATARRALYEAPDDPVMNRYYLATLGAREVTLRRLTTVLPASQQVLEY